MKRYLIVIILLVCPTISLAALAPGLYSGREEVPKSCPGSLQYTGQLFIETTNTTLQTYSGAGVIGARMNYAQRRVNEAEHCQLTDKQASIVSKNYEKQYEKTEKKIVKVKNNSEIVTKVANQNLAQTKRLSELSAKNPKKTELLSKMTNSGNVVTGRILGKTNKDQLTTYQDQVTQVKNTAKEKFAPSSTPKSTIPAPTPPQKTTSPAPGDDCLPGETAAQCNEEDWDGKYYSAEEYERANGLR